MYRRSDPRWNRTLQHISDNLEQANESAQENLYGFTQRYVSPCFASVSQCIRVCATPCLPTPKDRRRQQRGRGRGRAESSFDFYDDWDADESESLLGWGSDNLERFLGGASTYGATAQPTRQPAMGYGPRSRDPRYGSARRKSTALPREPAQDPTLIPSSSYFGFLGRMPWRTGAKGLRYKPSAADLTDHPGGAWAVRGEDQPRGNETDDSDVDGSHGDAHAVCEAKRHSRQRSDTRTSGHTTDSLSSRGDIFPSEDELEDAVPLDDEFTIALERRTTCQWNEDSSGKSKHPSGSRMSTHTASSRNTHDSRSPSAIDQASTPDTREYEQERLLPPDEPPTECTRHGTRQLTPRRSIAPECPPPTASTSSVTPRISSHQSRVQMAIVRSTMSPLMRSPTSETSPPTEALLLPSSVDAEDMPDSGSFYVAEGDGSNMGTIDIYPYFHKEAMRASSPLVPDHPSFVPARLPQFGPRPG